MNNVAGTQGGSNLSGQRGQEAHVESGRAPVNLLISLLLQTAGSLLKIAVRTVQVAIRLKETGLTVYSTGS